MIRFRLFEKKVQVRKSKVIFLKQGPINNIFNFRILGVFYKCLDVGVPFQIHPKCLKWNLYLFDIFTIKKTQEYDIFRKKSITKIIFWQITQVDQFWSFSGQTDSVF